MGKRRSLADDIADLITTAPTTEHDPEVEELGDAAVVLESDEDADESLPAKKRSKRAPEQTLRIRADIDLDDAEYAGRATSRAAAFGESDDSEEFAEGLPDEAEEDEEGEDERVQGSTEGEDSHAVDEAADDSELDNEHREVATSREHPLDDTGQALENAYAEVQAADAAALQQMKSRIAKDRAKGQAARNQQKIWDRLLEMRILLQKAMTASQQLPRPNSFPAIKSADAGLFAGLVAISQATKDTSSELLSLHKAMTEQNPETLTGQPRTGQQTASSANGNDASNDEVQSLWKELDRSYSEIAKFRDSSLDRWHRKTLIGSGAPALKGNLRMLNQSVSSQVAKMLQNPDRLIQRTQLPLSALPRRLCSGLTAEVADSLDPETSENPTDPETFDDSEFYQQLLREFLEASNADTSDLGLKSSTRGKKSRAMRDRRASKGRRLRYDIQDKLVNFMAAKRYEEPAMAPQLFRNLFGQQTVQQK